MHRKNVPKGQSATGKGYDPLARNPTYARAHLAGGYWELGVLAQHNHPSVCTLPIINSIPVPIKKRRFQCDLNVTISNRVNPIFQQPSCS